MDNLIDKFSHKFNSQEVIRANHEADARALDSARSKINEYEQAAAEVRRLSLKCVETNEATKQHVAAGLEKLDSLSVTAAPAQNAEISEESLKPLMDKYSDSIKEQNDYIHKESVRVYRNVQASMVDELKLQTEALALHTEQLSGKIKAVKGVAVASLIFGILSTLLIAGDLIIKIFDITF